MLDLVGCLCVWKQDAKLQVLKKTGFVIARTPKLLSFALGSCNFDLHTRFMK